MYHGFCVLADFIIFREQYKLLASVKGAMKVLQKKLITFGKIKDVNDRAGTGSRKGAE